MDAPQHLRRRGGIVMRQRQGETHLVVEGDHGHPVVGAEQLGQHARGGQHGLQWLAAHRARAVDHRHHVDGGALGDGRRRGSGQLQQHVDGLVHLERHEGSVQLHDRMHCVSFRDSDPTVCVEST